MSKKNSVSPLQELSEMCIGNMLITNKVKKFVEDLKKAHSEEIEAVKESAITRGIAISASIVLISGMKDLAEQIFFECGIHSIRDLIDCDVDNSDIERVRRSGILDK